MTMTSMNGGTPIDTNLGGFNVDEAIATKAFYGMRLNSLTGHLAIEEITNGDLPIALPQDNVLNINDYKQWMWSKAKLAFTFSEKGHLLLTVG